MFDPTKEVPSLELCRKFRELGFPQDGGGWYWIKYRRFDREITKLVYQTQINLIPNSYGADIYYPNGAGHGSLAITWYAKAPTVRELGEWLPDLIIFKHKGKEWWCIHHTITKESNIKAYTEANARAKLLIWLAKNGHVKFGDKEDNKNAKEK